MKAAYGDYDGGRIVVAGDGPMVVYSTDQGKTWTPGDINCGYTQNNGRFFVAGNIVYGNGVFLINSGDKGTVTRADVAPISPKYYAHALLWKRKRPCPARVPTVQTK